MCSSFDQVIVFPSVYKHNSWWVATSIELLSVSFSKMNDQQNVVPLGPGYMLYIQIYLLIAHLWHSVRVKGPSSFKEEKHAETESNICSCSGRNALHCICRLTLFILFIYLFGAPG